MEDIPWPCQTPAHLVQTSASPSWLVAVRNLKKWKLYPNGRQQCRNTCPTHCIALGSAAPEPQRLNRAAKKTKTTQFNRIQCVPDIVVYCLNLRLKLNLRMVIRGAVCLKRYKSFVILKRDHSLQEAVTEKGKNDNFIVTGYRTGCAWDNFSF